MSVMVYCDIDKAVNKRFEKLQIDFEILLKDSDNKINFGNSLRGKQDLDYVYLYYKGGFYEIYRYNKLVEFLLNIQEYT